MAPKQEDPINYSGAKVAMDIYFKKKEFHCGGSIPKAILYTKENIELVAKTSWNELFPLVYKKMGIAKYQLGDKPSMDNKIREGVNHVLDLLNEMRETGISSEYMGGLVWLHLVLCEGYE